MNNQSSLKNIYVDFEQLREIMASVYSLTHVKMTLSDADGDWILAYPDTQSRFCRMIRSTMLDYCDMSDKYAFEVCRKTGEVVTYFCHAGLIEVVVPLKDEDELIGFIMFGQLIPSKDRQACADQICGRFGKSFPPEEIYSALAELTAWNDDQINAATIVMKACISYILSLRIISTEKSQTAKRLNDYIDAHLSEELTPETISKYFSISRTSLYSLSQKLFGESIMAYIRKRRIDKAKELLSSTSLPLTVIAEQVGFDDYNYFIRVFKQMEGVACREYRKKYGANLKEKPEYVPEAGPKEKAAFRADPSR